MTGGAALLGRRFAIGLPACTLVGAAVLELIPPGIGHLAGVRPLLVLSVVYYWSIYRPELIPIPLVFAIGLVSDLLSGGPLGLSALLLVALHGFCVSQRRVLISRTFGVSWAGFIFVAIGIALFYWIVASLYFVRLIDPRPLLVQFALTIALYPVVNWLCNRTEQIVARGA
jgi:rod shape-determining protein MreD